LSGQDHAGSIGDITVARQPTSAIFDLNPDTYQADLKIEISQ
jgi:hypothetical protein